MTGHRDVIRLMAEHIAIGQTIRDVCPVCHGGSAGERSLSITRTGSGLQWLCHRASCPGCRGVSIEVGELTAHDRRAQEQPKLRPYTGPLYQLTDDDVEYFWERFGIDADMSTAYIRATDRGEYAINVYTPMEYIRGVIIRQPTWAGQPQPPRQGSVNPSMPKALLYMHAEGPTQSWHPAYGSNTVVLVEDSLSAMRAQRVGVTAVALLGTHLNTGKVCEIAAVRPTEVIVALDADATESAFKIAQKWGLAFRRTRVAILQRDLKDLETDDDVREALGL